MKNEYAKILRPSIVSRSGRNEKAGIGSYIIMSTVSRTQKIEIRVRVPTREEMKTGTGRY